MFNKSPINLKKHRNPNIKNIDDEDQKEKSVQYFIDQHRRADQLEDVLSIKIFGPKARRLI